MGSETSKKKFMVIAAEVGKFRKNLSWSEVKEFLIAIVGCFPVYLMVFLFVPLFIKNTAQLKVALVSSFMLGFAMVCSLLSFIKNPDQQSLKGFLKMLNAYLVFWLLYYLIF